MTRGQQAARSAATLFECVAAIFLASTMLLTVADVVLRTISEEWRIYGIVEIVELTFACSVFLALPALFLFRKNILVNIIDGLISLAVFHWLVILAALLTLVYLAFLGSQIWVTANEALRFNDQTMYIEIPVFVYWLPILLGVAGAFCAELYVLVTAADRNLENEPAAHDNQS
jgi:TRAP-type C4-dicarboxylate transport system permease small subunit